MGLSKGRTGGLLATTAKSARIESGQRVWASKMPFSTGEEKLLQLNQEEFDFNIQFEQLFFSIIPSVLFIITSLWWTVSQARKQPYLFQSYNTDLPQASCNFFRPGSLSRMLVGLKTGARKHINEYRY